MDFAMVPIMRYNERFDEARLCAQLERMRDQGFGGVFVETGKFHGLDTPRYLSRAWWRDTQMAVRLCEQVGIDFWIYDDEDWPSASAGGQLPGDNSRLQAKFLRHRAVEARGPRTFTARVGRDFLGAVAVPTGPGRSPADRTVVHPHRVRAGRLRIELGDGRWRIHFFSHGACKGWFLPLHPDPCDDALCRTFVDRVHGGYERHFPEKLGKVIRGTFTDEVTISTAGWPWFNRFPYAPSFPWSARLPEEYRRRTGRDLLADLPEIVEGDGKAGLQGRADHWATLGSMHAEHYYRRIGEWCERHGMISTGHLMGEEFLEHQVTHSGGDPMELQSHQHMPGIDWIHPFEFHRNFPIAVPKLAVSAAHQHGKPRVMSESFAAAGWGLSFEDMMRILNFQFACGIGFIVPITFRYTLQDRKHFTFYPPGIAVQQPYFEHFRPMADYVRRMCLMNSVGQHAAEVAVLHPTTEARTLFPDFKAMRRATRSYNGACEELARQQIDFDIIDEAGLSRGRVIRDRGLRIGEETYQAILVPRMRTIRAETLRRLDLLARRGVPVVWLSEIPRTVLDTGDDRRLRDLHGALGIQGNHTRPRGDVWPSGRSRHRHRFVKRDVTRALRRLRGSLQCAVKRCSTPHLLVQHRIIDGESHFLCFNRSASHRVCEVTFSQGGHVTLLDAMTGKPCEAPSVKRGRGSTTISLSLMPFEAVWVAFHRDPRQCAPSLRWADPKPVRTLGGLWRFTGRSITDDPDLRQNFCQRSGRLRGRVPRIPERIRCGDWCKQGLATFSGVGCYERTFTAPPQRLRDGEKWVLDLGRVAHTARVWLNGDELGTLVHAPFRLDITDALRRGENTLRVEVANTLVNYYSQFKGLRGASHAHGGTGHHSHVSGLLGPVRICRWYPRSAGGGR
jgi:hypothetical protein